MQTEFPRRISLLVALAAAFVTGSLLWPSAQKGTNETKRFPYEHVVRITATIEFDGERIEIDDLIDCRSEYEGPASRAAQLGFKVSSALPPRETEDGGMIAYFVESNVCSAFADRWAGVERKYHLPNTWLPIIKWLDNADQRLASRGEEYYSETAIRNPNGRLKIIDDFVLSYPKQTEELVAIATAQANEYRARFGDDRGAYGSFKGAKKLPWYIRIPREFWSKPPTYRMAPDRAFDPEGLRALLDGFPEGDELIYLGNQITASDGLSFTINDLISGQWGSSAPHFQAGIPQRDEPLWGMRINQATWDAAKRKIERIPFFDAWIPLDLRDGTLVLRTDTPGMRYIVKGYGDWYRGTERPFNFLDRAIEDGAYDLSGSLFIFDTKTRDLWVRGN